MAQVVVSSWQERDLKFKPNTAKGRGTYYLFVNTYYINFHHTSFHFILIITHNGSEGGETGQERTMGRGEYDHSTYI
jgi:hypothetical protein